VQAAADYCGVRAWTISEAVYDGRLPARRLGRSLVILKDDLDCFLSSLPTVEPSTAPSILQRKKRRQTNSSEVRTGSTAASALFEER
jgi:excisionase family DNA binding protein